MNPSDPILSHLKDGGSVLTPNRRLSRDLLHRYSEMQRATGQTVWQTPLVLPFDAFLQRLHGELLVAGEVSSSVLDRTQAEQMWLNALNSVIRQQSQSFLSPVKTAASLSTAWGIMQAYRASEAEASAGDFASDVATEFASSTNELPATTDDAQGDLFAEPELQPRQEPKQALQDAEFAYGGRDVKLFLEVADVYKNLLSKENLVDLASLPQHLCRALTGLLANGSAASLRERLPSLASPICVVGFLRLTPQQQAFLSVLNGCQKVTELAPAEQFAYKYKDANAKHDLQGVQSVRAGFANSEGEWRACANWCLHLLNKRKSLQEGLQKGLQNGLQDNQQNSVEKFPKIGVVLPDLANDRAAILRTFDTIFFPGLMPSQILVKGRPYDIGIGSPLAEWPLVQPALSLIDLTVGALDASLFSQMLLSPYTGAVDKELHFRLGFDRTMRSAGSYQISLQALLQLQKIQDTDTQEQGDSEGNKRYANQLPLGLVKMLQRLEAIPLDDAPLAEWCTRFNNILKAARWPGKALDSHEHQTVQAWKELVLGLARLDNVTESLSASAAVSLLKRSAMQRLFQPQTDELPVQLLTPQDSVGLEFTHLWVCGMDANHWPGAATPDAWLPRPWQKDLGVPKSSAQQCSVDAANLLQSWLASGAKILFSYSLERDEQEVQVAAAIQTLPDVFDGLAKTDEQADGGDEGSEGNEAGYADWRSLLFEPVDSRVGISEALQLQALHDRIGPAIADGQEVKGGARFFEDQAQCPFRAFVNHRLRAKSLEEAAPGLDARKGGTVLHLAMQLLWQKLRTREKFASLAEADRVQVIEDVVDQAISEELSDEMQAVEQDLERNRLCELIAYWMQERELPRSNFEVIDTEREVTLEIESMKFSLAVDRIDQLESGEQIVIDYKTGSGNKPSAWMQQRPQSPQLPLYSLSQDKVDGLGFAELNRNNPAFAGIACSKDLLKGLRLPTPKEIESAVDPADEKPDGQDSWAITRQLWRERIDGLAVEIKSGYAVVEPQKNACLYCDLAGLCRIDPQRLEEVLEAESDESTESELANRGRQ